MLVREERIGTTMNNRKALTSIYPALLFIFIISFNLLSSLSWCYYFLHFTDEKTEAHGG